MRGIRTNFFYHRCRKKEAPLKVRMAAGIPQNRLGLFLAFLRSEGIWLSLGAFLLAGVAVGAVFTRHADSGYLEKLDVVFCSSLSGRMGKPLGEIFIASFASAFLFVFSCFLLGLSFWGTAVIPFLLFFRGFGLGLTSGYLYSAYAWKGMLFYLSVILPGAFLFLISLLFAAREGMRFSKTILWQGAFSGKRRVSDLGWREYISRFGGYLVLSAAASGMDVLLTACFSGIFSF